MRGHYHRLFFIALVTNLMVATWCRGAQLAFDSAADPAYNSGWAGNGGSGWGSGWFMVASFSNYFVGSSATNGIGDPDANGDINTPQSPGGRAWGMRRAALAGPPDAQRKFNGNLSVGQTFEIDMDNGFTTDVFSSGWGLKERPGDPLDFTFLFRLYYDVNTAHYVYLSGSSILDSGIPLTDQGLHCEFTLTGPSSYSLAITPLAPGSSTTTLSGELTALKPIGGLDLLFSESPSPTPDAVNLFFNNIAVTPEPSLPGMTGAFAISALIRRRSERGKIAG